MWDFPGNYSRCRLVALEGCFSAKDFKGGQFSISIEECHHVQTTFFVPSDHWGGGSWRYAPWVGLATRTAGFVSTWVNTPHWQKGSPSVLQRFGWEVVRAFWLDEIRWFLSPPHSMCFCLSVMKFNMWSCADQNVVAWNHALQWLIMVNLFGMGEMQFLLLKYAMLIDESSWFSGIPNLVKFQVNFPIAFWVLHKMFYFSNANFVWQRDCH